MGNQKGDDSTAKSQRLAQICFFLFLIAGGYWMLLGLVVLFGESDNGRSGGWFLVIWGALLILGGWVLDLERRPMVPGKPKQKD